MKQVKDSELRRQSPKNRGEPMPYPTVSPVRIFRNVGVESSNLFFSTIQKAFHPQIRVKRFFVGENG